MKQKNLLVVLNNGFMKACYNPYSYYSQQKKIEFFGSHHNSNSQLLNFLNKNLPQETKILHQSQGHLDTLDKYLEEVNMINHGITRILDIKKFYILGLPQDFNYNDLNIVSSIKTKETEICEINELEVKLGFLGLKETIKFEKEDGSFWYESKGEIIDPFVKREFKGNVEEALKEYEKLQKSNPEKILENELKSNKIFSKKATKKIFSLKYNRKTKTDLFIYSALETTNGKYLIKFNNLTDSERISRNTMFKI